MALPNTIDPSTPTGGSALSLGDDQIRALKQFLVDVFGLPNNQAVSNATFSIDLDGDITAIRLEGAIIDPIYLDTRDLSNATDSFWFKGSRPHIRFVGTETSGKDWRIIEDAGVISFEQNTGTEAVPIWERRILLASTTGNPLWYSGQAFTVEFDHGATANLVITIPTTANTTLVGTDIDQDISNKTLLSCDGVTMSAGAIITAAAVAAGTPAQHGLFRENVPKFWCNFGQSGGVPTLVDGFNVASIGDPGPGTPQIVFSRAFSNTTYAIAGLLRSSANSANLAAIYFEAGTALQTDSCTIRLRDSGGNNLDTCDLVTVMGMGDQ